MTLKELAPQVWQDLLPTPGRTRDATKVMLATLLVCVFMFATSMPLVDFGAYLVFLMAQRDTMRTRLLASGGFFVAFIATILIVGVMILAWDIAWLRLLLWTLIFFAGYFLMRIFIEPDVFLGPLVIIALFTFITDLVPVPNLLLDQLGWLWALLPVVVCAVLLMDWLLGASTPRETLQQQTWRIFQRVEDGMCARAIGKTLVPLDQDEIDDAVKRASLLAQTRVFSSTQASRTVELLRRVTHLEKSATQVGFHARQPAYWTQLSGCIASVRKRIQRGRESELHTSWPLSALHDDLAESVERFRQSAEGLETGAPPGTDGALDSTALFLPDWKTNPAYISFALRATAATMATYLFMSLTNWNGIHTCMITCTVTALSSVGAQVQKQNLRLVGAVIGGIAGVAALLFILPMQQNLLTLLIVIGLTSFAAAWVAVGPLRISYAGLQMALAVFYVLLAGAHITTDLDPIRDRLIGIFIGIMAMRAAFVWFAPANTGRRPSSECSEA